MRQTSNFDLPRYPLGPIDFVGEDANLVISRNSIVTDRFDQKASTLNVLGCENARLFESILFSGRFVAGWMNQRQQHVVEYLTEENRVLREQIGTC